MNCSDLTRWLDAGMPAGSESAARDHAARCEGCAAALRADLEIAALLGRGRAVLLPDSSQFVGRVMVEVESAERREPRFDLWPAFSPLPWWIQAAADPAAVLACALVALLLWRPGALTDLTRYLSDRWSILAWPALTQAKSLLGLDRPAIAMGLGFLGLLLVGWVSLHLYRWTERLARRSAGA
jgi:hypothetical protein